MSQHRLVLDVDSLVEEFFADTCLFGLQIKNGLHRFVWQVNEMIGFDFQFDYEKQIDYKHFTPENQRDSVFKFHVYSFTEHATGLGHHIYNNTFDGGFLVPDLRYFNCLWLLKGDAIPEPEVRNYLQSAIRALPEVQMISEVPTDQLKMRERLIF